MLNSVIQDDGGEEDFTGAVRSIRIERAQVSISNDSYEEGDRLPLRAINFDEQGRKEEECSFISDGSVGTRAVFTYDAEARPVEVRHFDYGQYAGKTLYTYGGAGQLEQEVRHAPDGTVLSRTEYRYDVSGNRVEVAHWGPDGSLITRMLSRYDDENKVAEVTYCGGQGSRLVTRRGSMIEALPDASAYAAQDNICGDGVFITKFVFTYDDQGYESGVLQYGGAGVLISRRTFARDTERRQQAMCRYGPEGEILEKEEHRREFDAHGNWIKDTKYMWDTKADALKPTEATYRTIVYY